MKIEIILRSKTIGRKLGRFEGFYPFKHVGIKVSDGQKSEVHHVQKVHPWPLSRILIAKCNIEAFSEEMGVKSLVSKEASAESVKKSIEIMENMSGKRYIPILRDCDYIAGVCFNGRRFYLLHRQLWVYFCLSALIYSSVNGYGLARYHWDSIHPFSNWSAVITGSMATVVFGLIFFLKINNTSVRQTEQSD